ncbi:hypothetical protein, partial [Armatimonas sp.]|uniref:hypothetical protein n=1 Tax=Armatimonas sp. TaxID=1872638 RepID=UPI00286B177F
MKRIVMFMGLISLGGLVGCSGTTVAPQVTGRVLKGSGGCGAPPPDGVCPNPVVYSGFASARLRVSPESSETVIAMTTADAEGNFTLALPAGTYRVSAEQMPGFGVLMTIT